MKITSITGQINDPRRFSISLDGKFAFGIDQSILLDQKLRVGLELDDEQIEYLKSQADFGKWYAKCVDRTYVRPRSQKEIRDYLREKGRLDLADALVAKLVDSGRLDDKAFAEWWIESRRRSKQRSNRALTAELRQKGVDASVIRELLSDSSELEREALGQLIAKKRRLPRYQDDEKLTQYLVRLGYGYDQVKQSLII